jgi:hypothetical protein
MLGVTQGDAYRDESLLGAIVEVAFDATSLFVRGGNDPCA